MWLLRVCGVPALVMVLAAVLAGTVRAQDEIPVRLRAKTFRYDRTRMFLWAEGDVVVAYQDVTIRADRLEADLGTNDVRAEGNVRVEVGRHAVRARALAYNLQTRRGRLTQAAADYTGPFVLGTVHLRAEVIEGVLGGVTAARQVSCTTCEGPDPVAYLTAQEFTLYPGDKIVGRNVSVWVAGRKVITWPQFVIFLREQRASRLLPVFGYSESEGYYVKTFYSYAISPDHYGYLRLDYMDRLGTAVGLEHAYRFGPASSGVLFLYSLRNKQIGGMDHRITVNHQQRLGDVSARLYTDALTRTSPRAPSSDLFTSLDLSWRTPRSFTMLYQTLANASSNGIATAQYTMRSIHMRQLTEALSMEVIADGFRTASPAGVNDELLPRLALRYRGAGYTASLIAEGRLDLDGAAFPGDSGFFVERLPELRATLDTRLLRGTGLAYQVQGGLGQFRERQPAGTIQALRSELTVTLSGFLLESPRGFLNLHATVRGSYYATGDTRGFLSGRLEYTRWLGEAWQGQVGLTYQDQVGRTPFAFDRLLGRIASTDVSLTYRRSTLLTTMSGSFDGVTGRWQPVIARALYAPRERWAIAAALEYDPSRGALSRAELAFDITLGAHWQAQFYGFYDGPSGRVFTDRITITRVWADCLATSLAYRGPTHEFWFEAWLTALPWARGQIGVGSQGQLLFNQPWLGR